MQQVGDQFQANMPPIFFRLGTIQSIAPTWNPDLLVLFVSEGHMDLQVNGQLFVLSEQQIAIVNPMEIYAISGGNGVLAYFCLDVQQLSSYCPSFQLPPLQTLVQREDNSANHRQILELLSDIIRMSIAEPRSTRSLDYLSNGAKLLSLLTEYCARKDERAIPANPHLLPLLEACAFTAAHCQEPITVRDAAAAARFSPPYFSKLFTSFMGVPYTEYLTELRLQNAQRKLKQGMGISRIADSCGFSDHRAFARAYRKKYGCNPSEARNSLTDENTQEHLTPAPLPPSLGQQITECLERMSTDTQLPVRFKYIELSPLSLLSPRQSFPHTWQKTIGIGRAIHLLHQENQQMLRDLQENIHFQFAMLHCLLDDDMQTVYRNDSGELCYYFGTVDAVLDFLLSIGLQPVVQLGFMPSILAADRSNTLYEGRSIISLPSSLDAWEQLVRQLIQHLFRRYGISNVEQWEFTLWSKPDSAPLPFGFPNVDEYFAFYHCTFHVVKECSPKLRFGSPAFMPDSLMDDAWLNRFWELCRTHKCLPDTLRFDFYPMLCPSLPFDIGRTSQLRFHSSPESMRQFFSELDHYIKKQRLPYTRPELEEWNFSISQRELINDTSYKAAFIVKNMLECWDRSSDLSYWGFSDTLGETLLTNDLFHGGLGLFAKGHLRKPSYYAFWLLSKLGTHILRQEDGYVVTSSAQGIQILFYNYCHYSALYASGDRLSLTYSSRYTPFVDQRRTRFSLTLTDLSASRYLVTNYRLNRQYGSVFDNWVAMGAPPQLSHSEFSYLQGCSQPLMTKSVLHTENDTLKFTPELEPFEVSLFELLPLGESEGMFH